MEFAIDGIDVSDVTQVMIVDALDEIKTARQLLVRMLILGMPSKSGGTVVEIMPGHSYDSDAVKCIQLLYSGGNRRSLISAFETYVYGDALSAFARFGLYESSETGDSVWAEFVQLMTGSYADDVDLTADGVSMLTTLIRAHIKAEAAAPA